MADIRRLTPEDGLDQALSRIEESAPANIREVLFSSQQSTLGKAVLADVVDIIPLVGDAANIFRVRDAARRSKGATKRVSLQAVDLVLGAAPFPIGVILDALTPTNTITYLRGR